jgi:phospholipid/cholesterol/gamma-HCH transport system permease protein
MATSTETQQGSTILPAPVRRAGRGARDALEGPAGILEQIAGMLILAGKSIVTAFTPPFDWRGEFVDESFLLVKRCLIPVALSCIGFGFGAPGLQASNLVQVFGTIDREGSFFVMASVREFAPWVNGMVLAGVGGTAICADLGARKVREELDALAVLGLDPIRTLVVPRFLALGLVTALMNLPAIVFGVFGGWIAAVPFWEETTAGFLMTFNSNFTPPDLIGSVVKTSLFGFIIAIACCYKGMNVSGGAEGVGRAVNQAVVMAFAGIWVFTYMFTTVLLAAYPETTTLR